MNGIILAGGKSSRMGTNKAFLKIGDRVVINIILERLKKLCSQISIVTNNFDEYRHLDVELVQDLVPISCSLVGLYSGLQNSKEQYSFVVACDMPLINEGLVKYMYSCKEDYDIIAPIINGYIEPLFAIYSNKCIPEMKFQINSENFKITHLFKKLKVRLIEEDEIKLYDPTMLSFINLNTEEDYLKCKNLVIKHGI